MRNIYFVVLPRLVLLDLAGPAEAFRLAALKVPASYTLHFISPARTVLAAIGLQMSALEPLPPKLPADAIVVITGISGDSVDLNDPATQRVVAWQAGMGAVGAPHAECLSSRPGAPRNGCSKHRAVLIERDLQ